MNEVGVSEWRVCHSDRKRSHYQDISQTSVKKLCIPVCANVGNDVECLLRTRGLPVITSWRLLKDVPYFHALLSFTDHSSQPCGAIDLSEFEEFAVARTMQYLRQGDCIMTVGTLPQLLHIADFLRIDSFVKYCLVKLHGYLLSLEISIQEAHELISQHELGIDRFLLYNICDIAVEHGYLPLIQYGLSLGMNPNIAYEELRDMKSGHNLFFKSIINGHFHAAKVLLEAGANVNYQKRSLESGNLLDEHDTPWIENFHAVRLRYVNQGNTAGYLCSSTRGTTALHIAVCNKRLDLIELLLNHGAKFQPDQDGETAVHVASYYGSREILEYLVTHNYQSMFNVHSNIMGTPLFRAVMAGNLDIVKYMLSNGADVTQTDYTGFTALSYAAVANNLEILKYIKEQYSLSLCDQNDTHETALHQCACLGHVDVVKYCIEMEPELMSIQDERGDTLLHVAVLYDQMSTASVLIKAGSNVDIPNYLNEHPLHIALMENCTEIIPGLLNAGANPNAILNIRDTSTPLTLAIMCGGETTLEYVKLLLKHGAEARTLHDKALILALRENIQQKEETVETLLTYGADPNARSRGSPVLVDICATQNPPVNLVKLLLKFGANVNSTNRKCMTPLMTACSRGNKDIVELLLKNGADASIRSWSGHTAMTLASEAGLSSTSEITRQQQQAAQ